MKKTILAVLSGVAVATAANANAPAVKPATVALNNGLAIPQFGLGSYNSSVAQAKDALAVAIKVGYRHVDTAHAYQNERGVGAAVKESGVPRDQFWITSKLWPTDYDHGNAAESINKMLKRLGTDYVDLVYLHQGIVERKKTGEEKELKRLNQQIEKAQSKIDKLLDLRLSEEIDRDDYARKREELDKLIAQAQEKIAQISKYQAMEDSIEARVNAMKEVIEGQKEYDFTRIPEDIIRAFVDKIVVYEDYLEWHLILDETTQMRLSCTGQKRNHEVVFLPDTPLNSEPQHRLQSSTRADKRH